MLVLYYSQNKQSNVLKTKLKHPTKEKHFIINESCVRCDFSFFLFFQIQAKRSKTTKNTYKIWSVILWQLLNFQLLIFRQWILFSLFFLKKNYFDLHCVQEKKHDKRNKKSIKRETSERKIERENLTLPLQERSLLISFFIWKKKLCDFFVGRKARILLHFSCQIVNLPIPFFIITQTHSLIRARSLPLSFTYKRRDIYKIK